MRAALHTWSLREKFQEPGFDIFQALDLAADMGFTGIEIMSGKAKSPPDHIGPGELSHLEKVMAHARKRGIDVLCLSTYNDFAYVKDEDWRLANIEYIKEWLGYAGKLGVPNIRMLTGYYIEGEDRSRLEQLTREGIRECVSAAEDAGVNMAIENHNTIFFSAQDILNIIEEMGSQRVTACPDPSNWCRGFFEEDCPDEERESVYRQLEMLAPKATQSHLKLRGITEDGKIRGFDIPRLIGIYRKAGYDGAITFESVAKEDLLAPLAKAREILETAIKEHGGV